MRDRVLIFLSSGNTVLITQHMRYDEDNWILYASYELQKLALHELKILNKMGGMNNILFTPSPL